MLEIDISPYTDGLFKGLLQGLRLAWPVWVALGLLVVGALGLGIYRRLLVARSGLKDVDRMSGVQFEHYLAVLFGRLGFKVERTAERGDYGADLIVRRQDERIVVQAKRYKRKVGVRAVQEAVAARGYYSCEKAMVITNSFFSSQAMKLAGKNKVELWDRYRLARAMASIGGKRTTRQTMAQKPAVMLAVSDELPGAAVSTEQTSNSSHR